ncbi:hypothetical protein [Zavarzinella formosa]|uniref:hypothetical protein n=1 Tax=Zavarzinella formosa TaxID=360055 RepID=UPI0002D2981B|nr:hypothetical protein [Zavarzinella formosa]
MRQITIWIAAENWEAGHWTPDDDATDVIVTLEDGSRWVATFCSFRHMETIRQKYSSTGECLHGKYFWLSDLILIDDTSRRSIEVVVENLLASGEFAEAFERAPANDETPTITKNRT